jgi:N-methylhydantoinase A
VVSVQVSALVSRKDAHRPGKASEPSGRARIRPTSRKAYFGERHGWLDTRVISRADLEGGASGPLIVEEYDTTAVVPPGAAAELDALGNIIITL